jgi:subtilisin family serine protease
LLRRAGFSGIVLAAVLIALLHTGGAAASSSGPLPRTAPSAYLERLSAHPAMAAKGRRSDPWTKVGQRLREVVAGFDLDGISPWKGLSPRSLQSAARRLVQARPDGFLHVSLRRGALGPPERKALRDLGFQPTFDHERFDFAEGWLPAQSVEAAARLPFVLSVSAAIPPLTSAGSVTTQGDAILQAARARAEFGVDGTGVTVGVVSDSADGLSSSVATGDLPGNVQVLKSAGGTGEGTAMLEIVHDLAPGASLSFYGPKSSGDMIAGLERLANSGARVIVDDLTFFDQPHFEEGPIAREIDALADLGIVYVTSAGNYAASASTDRGHYEADFVEGGALGGARAHVHQFAPGVVRQAITVWPETLGMVFLQWADAFGRAGDDYDLYLLDETGRVVASGTDLQNGNDNPIEYAIVDNLDSESPLTLYAVIDRYSGAPKRLEIYYSGFSDIEFGTVEGSIAGHANASGAITVGAINAGDPGTDHVAFYSSRGPAEVFFPRHEVRDKPEIAGIDGVSVTGAFGFPKSFYGTSAAAPHIAALAALVLSKNPSLSPSAIRQALQSTAVDLGAAGFDFDSGSGRAEGRDAVAFVQLPGAGGSSPSLGSLIARLHGNVLSLSGLAADADADIVEARVVILDATSNTLTATPFFDARVFGELSPAYELEVGGLEAQPSARKVGLILKDAQDHQSNAILARFDQADAGGGRIFSASYDRSSRALQIIGSNFRKGATQIELNGVLVSKPARVNKTANKATIAGSLAKLGLVKGPNRVRVVMAGAVSNIFILYL